MSGCPFHQTSTPQQVSSVPERAVRAKRVSLPRLGWNLVSARFHFIHTLQRLFKATGSDTLSVWLPRTNLYISADPKLCREILVDRPEEYPKTGWEHRVLSPAMEDGLIILDGEEWKTRRHASASCFGAKSIAQLAGILSEVSARRVSGWDHAEGRSIELNHEFRCVINESMMRFFLDGSSLDETLPGGSDEFSHAFSRVEKGLETRVFDVLFLKERLRTLVSPSNGFHRSLHTVTNFIEERVFDSSKSAGDQSALKNLMDRIPSRRSVSREIRNMSGAGATTAHLLSWIGHLLASHPEKQERLRTEVLGLQLTEQGPELSEIEKLPYLSAVINEGLRLFPPAPYLIRKHVSGRKGERPSFFMFSVWAIHRDPKVWRDADQFAPERWLDDSEIPEQSFIPFGVGPRVCIGKRFALTEARIILSTLLRRFRLELIPNGRIPLPVFTVLTRPDRGVRVGLVPILREALLPEPQWPLQEKAL